MMLGAQTLCPCRRDAQTEGILQCVRQHMCLPLSPQHAHTHNRSPLLQGRRCGRKGSAPCMCVGSQVILDIL